MGLVTTLNLIAGLVNLGFAVTLPKGQQRTFSFYCCLLSFGLAIVSFVGGF